MHDRRNFNKVSFESTMIKTIKSHTPHNLVTAFLCFRVLFFSGDALYNKSNLIIFISIIINYKKKNQKCATFLIKIILEFRSLMR